MTPSNIDKFNVYAANVLAALYESFPVPRHLSSGAFIEGGDAAVYDPKGITGAELMPDAMFFRSTVQWLYDAGYILCGKVYEADHADCVLTAKGLEVLSSIPGSLKNAPSLGDSLVSAVKQSAKDGLQVAIREVISMGVKIAMRHPY
ncbi:hypothetical protein J4G52_25190 [Burkholderia cenocepacia]|uniref:hypothetical protein n=1 Tax=Burkholderia cenocepacia TaxID=95486 RepID=UPI001AA16D71|nr:hypothetical protein [Burkholderia cenocepacia]MBO1856838.1 hypothetical protein [Burkholderia cenocepacia]